MTSKLKRIQVTFPNDLFALIEEDSDRECRSLSSQVVWIMDRYYSDRKRQADLFTSPRLRVASKPDQTPVYRMEEEPVVEAQENIRRQLGQEKTR